MPAKVTENSFGIVLDFGYGADVPPPLFRTLRTLGFDKIARRWISNPPPDIYKEQLQAAENIAYDYNQGKYRKYRIYPKAKQT